MIKIHRLYDRSATDSPEVRQADALANSFSDYLPPSAEGNIYVLPSMTCLSARRKDLDLVVWIDTLGFEVETISATSKNSLPIKRRIRVEDALIIFELKGHNEEESIRILHQNIYVKYNDDWHNASEQSAGQKHSLINLLNRNLGGSPFVVNLIWMHRVQNGRLANGDTVGNILWGSPDVRKLFQVVFRTRLPEERDGEIVYRASNNAEVAKRTTEYFEGFRRNIAAGIGKISNRKVSEIIEKEIEELERDYFNSIGSKLIIIKGNPGTGKTMHLVHLANNLSKLREMKCLMLTFNKALQQDIKRLLEHSGVDSLLNVNILTWDAFVYKCFLEHHEVDASKGTPDFDRMTRELCDETAEFQDGQAKELFKAANDYDCVLIDEAQDWSPDRVALIYKLFGYQNIVLSIGENQQVENLDQAAADGQQWNVGVNRNQRSVFYLGVSHRNKVNIVDFLNAFSHKSDYPWQLIKNNQLEGGRVIVTDNYVPLHGELVHRLLDNGNAHYDMMYLAGTNEQMESVESMIAGFGHSSFVASREENRNKPFPVDQFRVLSYQACRGLEGWTVVCYEWDHFIEETTRNIHNPNPAIIPNFTFMVMTRAIDSLVITLRNPKSEVSKRIIETVQRHSDFCEVRLSF